MPAHQRPQSSAWGYSIRKLVLTLCAALFLALGVTGCGDYPRANANIAFMGDSITALWWLPRTNLGVYGNTTTQMLARFPGQISGHSYKAVVILAGTNDVRIISTPIQQVVNTATGNIEKMAALAEANKLDVVLCMIPPIQGLDSRVQALDTAITALAQQHQYKVVDYYTPMVGHPEYFHDGEHPNDRGYFVMESALTPVMPLNY